MAYRTFAKPRLTLRDRYRAFAKEAGLLNGGKSRDLPENLCPGQMQIEQGSLRQAAAQIRQAFDRGEPVFHITAVPGFGVLPRSGLVSDAIIQMREWGARRARRVAKDGCRLRMVGVVDVSFNSAIPGCQERHWNVHLHVLAWLDQSRATGAKREMEDVEKLLRSAFYLAPHNTPHCQQPLQVRKIRDARHFNNTVAYHCGSLALHDASNSRRHLRTRDLRPSEKGYSKLKLQLVRRKQFTKLMAEIGPRAFRVLSGFRQHGDVVELHPK